MPRLIAFPRLTTLTAPLINLGKKLGDHRLTNANSPHFFQKRSIINVSELKSTFDNLNRHKHLALLEGGVLHFTNTLNTLYVLALAQPSPSAIDQLVMALFHKNGNEFHTTKNKSKPAFSLNSELIGKILLHLDAGTLYLPETRMELQAMWRKIHRDLTGGPLTIIQISLLIDKLIAAKQECDANRYFKNLTETILLSFIYLKSETRAEALRYLSEFDELQTLLDGPFKINDTFEEDDIKQGKNLLGALAAFIQKKKFDLDDLKNTVHDHYEMLVLTLMTRYDKLPKVLISSYGYGDTFRANCAESTYHNICNIFLYENKVFNFNLMPANLKPLQQFLQFYQMQDYKANRVNTREVGQAFMSIVSKQNFLIYDCGDFELLSVAENVLPLFNYLFGSTATNFEELSAQFSDDRRTITFKHVDKNVEIIIKYKNQAEEKLSITFTTTHTELTATRFQHLGTDDSSLSELAHLLDQANFEFENYSLLLPLLYQTTNVGKILSLTLRKPHNQTHEYFNYFITHFYPRDNYEAFMMMHDCLVLVEKFPEAEVFIKYLVKNFDNMLYYAVLDDKVEVVIKLLEYTVDVNARNKDAQTAIQAVKNIRVANILLAAGANPQIIDRFGKNALHYCHNEETFKKFIALKVSPELRDYRGRTPLFFCSHDPDVTILFLEARLDVNAVDSDNKTPIFYYADSSDNSAAMQCLLERNANVNHIDKYGRTALFYGKDATAAQLLITAGCNVDVIDENGETALHYAIKREFLEKAIVLVKANPNHNHNGGKSYLHSSLNVETTKLILNLKAKRVDSDRLGQTPLHTVHSFEKATALKAGGNFFACENATVQNHARTSAIAKFSN
jgi:ankyrin repeat protein